MMPFTVLLFGPYADAAGASRVQVELKPDAPRTAGDVLEALARAQPKLRGLLDGATLAVNCETVGPQQPVQASDELAVIGMVSGG